jgi:hypothetical protein
VINRFIATSTYFKKGGGLFTKSHFDEHHGIALKETPVDFEKIPIEDRNYFLFSEEDLEKLEKQEIITLEKSS